MINVPMLTYAAVLVAFSFGIAAEVYRARHGRRAANRTVDAARDRTRL